MSNFGYQKAFFNPGSTENRLALAAIRDQMVANRKIGLKTFRIL